VALDVMDLLVDNATSGILNLDLLLQQKIPSGGSYPDYKTAAGHWAIYGVAKEGQSLEEVEQLLLQVTDRLRKGEFTQEDIDAVVTNQEIEQKRSAESNNARVSRIAGSYIHGVPWQQASTRLDRMRKVTRDDVIAVATRYLGNDRAVVHRDRGDYTPPKIDKPKITPVSIDPGRKSPFAQRVEAMAAEPLSPRWLQEGKDYELVGSEPGSLIVTRNQRNDLFELTYHWELGTAAEPLVCHALRLMEKSGAADRSPQDVQKFLYRMGSSIQTRCRDEAVQITVQGLDRNMDATLTLLRRWLSEAQLTREGAQKLARNTISRRQDQVQRPEMLGAMVASFAALDKRSPFVAVASNQQLQKATPEELNKLLLKLLATPNQRTYFGPRPIEGIDQATRLSTMTGPAPEPEPRKLRRVKKPTVYFAHSDTAQSQAYILFPKAPFNAKELPLSQLYTHYMSGGMQALVFQEIREARGLAYSAFAYHDAGERPQDDAALRGIIRTQADKTTTALNAMLELMEETPLQPSRLKGAQTALLESLRAERIPPRRTPAAVLRWKRRGLQGDPRVTDWKELPTLSMEDFSRFARDVSTNPPVVALVGNRERIDMDALKKRFEIIEVDADDVVGY
jgi:predicted Zn-dependent peptidase